MSKIVDITIHYFLPFFWTSLVRLRISHDLNHRLNSVFRFRFKRQLEGLESPGGMSDVSRASDIVESTARKSKADDEDATATEAEEDTDGVSRGVRLSPLWWISS